MDNYPEFQPYVVQKSGLDGYLIQTQPAMQTMLLGLMVNAMAQFEGFYVPEDDPRYPTLAQRNNNPGNLRPVGQSTGFRTFPTVMDGWRAMIRQVLLNINRGLTLREFFLGKPGVYPGYSPIADPGNEAQQIYNYIEFVRQRMNISDSMPLARLFPDLSDFEFQDPLGYLIVWTYQPYLPKL